MPVVLSDRDALSIKSQLEAYHRELAKQPETDYRNLWMRIVRRHVEQLSAEPQPRSDIIRAVK